MRTYEIPEDVDTETTHPILGTAHAVFPASDAYEPRSEHEEILLEEVLVPQGRARRRDGTEPGEDAPRELVAHVVNDVPEDADELLAWLLDDPTRARRALEVELERKRPRRRIVRELEAIVVELDEADSADHDASSGAAAHDDDSLSVATGDTNQAGDAGEGANGSDDE